jgi:hypothetical protein
VRVRRASRVGPAQTRCRAACQDHGDRAAGEGDDRGTDRGAARDGSSASLPARPRCRARAGANHHDDDEWAGHRPGAAGRDGRGAAADRPGGGVGPAGTGAGPIRCRVRKVTAPATPGQGWWTRKLERHEHAGPAGARTGQAEPGGVRPEHRPWLAAAKEFAAGGTAEAIRAASWHTRQVLAGWSDGPCGGAA